MTCTLYRVDTGAAFMTGTLVTNDDGSSSCELVAGGYGGQEPNQYGVRADQSPNTGAPQQYQRFTLEGSAATFVTRTGDLPCGYFCAKGQVYPS